MTEKLVIREAIVVEGRDDTAAILRGVDGLTIETHGFGIKAGTWELIDKAYNEQGIIVFTDPDHAGEQIRKRIVEKYPDSKQAFLDRYAAEKNGDIGIENAKPEDIIDALKKCKCTIISKENTFTERDMDELGLTGAEDSKEKRRLLGKELGIGYGNSKSFLKKLNQFGITREELFRRAENL